MVPLLYSIPFENIGGLWLEGYCVPYSLITVYGLELLEEFTSTVNYTQVSSERRPKDFDNLA
jgi:hypothetical protein